MNQAFDKKRKILMLPCAGASCVGQMTFLAVQELVLEGKGEWAEHGKVRDLQTISSKPTDSLPFIVVDGCDQHCAKKCLEAISCDLEFHLSLADLGILKTESSEISYDELQLVKDAIIAESTRLSKHPPMMMGGCSCR